MKEKFLNNGQNLQINSFGGVMNRAKDDNLRPAVPANDAYFHPLFAPYTQMSPAGRSKMKTLGFKPVRVI